MSQFLVQMVYVHLKNAENPPLNVQRLTRKDILNINVLTRRNLETRLALIRTPGKAFQKASVIVMRANYPNGYILKEFFNVLDNDLKYAKWIDIKLPGATEDLNLGKVHLQTKYPTTLGQDLGQWINDLLEIQVHAKEYKDAEEYKLLAHK